MIDGCGRKIDYIRISVTDRCNLRCVYCMPEKGVPFVPHKEILSFDEILRLVRVLADLGIRKIKLTGGEPLVRKGIVSLVCQLKRIPGIEQVTITTNGILLSDYMEQLAEAGIDGINLSLDTLNPDLYERITRRRELDKALEGFFKALEYPEIPLKINCVPMEIPKQNMCDLSESMLLGQELPEEKWFEQEQKLLERNSQEWQSEQNPPEQNLMEIAELAKKYKVHVRFIEMMPIGLGKEYDTKTEDKLLTELEEKFGSYQINKEVLGNGPGHYYTFSGFKGKIGFISAVSHKFCDKCNRVRLTSQGYLKTCLQYDAGVDLKQLLRGGAADVELRLAVENAIGHKPIGHHFGERLDGHDETHIMAQIGG